MWLSEIFLNWTNALSIILAIWGKNVFNLSIMLGKVLFYVGQGFCFEMKKKKEKQTQKNQNKTQKHSL